MKCENKIKCPFCGEEMEYGFVTGGTTLTWRTKKKKVTINPYLNKKKGEFIFSYNAFGAAATAGQLCRKCKRIVVIYEDELE